MSRARSYSIESNSRAGTSYTVTRINWNTWQCTCPHWRYRGTDCAHIRKAQSIDAAGASLKPEPPIVYAHVREVTSQADGSLYVPLLPLDDVHFLSTLCFDLYAHGVRWATIAERYRLPSSITKDICIEFVEQHGRKIYQFSNDPAIPRHQYQILSGIPLPRPAPLPRDTNGLPPADRISTRFMPTLSPPVASTQVRVRGTCATRPLPEASHPTDDLGMRIS